MTFHENKAMMNSLHFQALQWHPVIVGHNFQNSHYFYKYFMVLVL